MLIGYHIVQPQRGCSYYLTKRGWICVVVLCILCPPLAWLPCIIPSCSQVSRARRFFLFLHGA